MDGVRRRRQKVHLALEAIMGPRKQLRRTLFRPVGICVAVAGMVVAQAVLGGTNAASATTTHATTTAQPLIIQRACGKTLPHHVRCQSEVVRDNAQASLAHPNTTVSGLSPTTVLGAYMWPKTGGKTQTIAIVDAGGDPQIATDLNNFDTHFSLPSCTTSNGCFRILNQTGTPSPLPSPIPPPTSGWNVEISLDVEWAHAIAPLAKLVLVESNTATTAMMFAAVTTAAKIARYVSMSWGITTAVAYTTTPIPPATETLYDKLFAKYPTVSFFAATGDTGGDVIYPATSPDVVAVGGTTLSVTKTHHTFSSEGAWSGGGGGCSTYETAPKAQKTFAGYKTAIAASTATSTVYGHKCKAFATAPRATPDISADANPSTGVAVYAASGWTKVGGTSVATPLVAARAADFGAKVTPATIYQGGINIRDITSGSNGHACTSGYDLCTGRGVWSGMTLVTTAVTNSVIAGTVEAFTISSTVAAPSGGIAISLSVSDASGTFSTTSTGTFSSTLSTTIAQGQTTKTLYFRDTKAGSPTVVVQSGGYTVSEWTPQIVPGSLTRIAISPSTAQSLLTNSSKTFSAVGYDAYSNVVTLRTTPSWSTTVSGATLSVSKGLQTTFKAPSLPTSGVVKATLGSITSSTSVSVTAPPLISLTVTAGSTTFSASKYSKVITAKATSSASKLSGATVSFKIYSNSCSGSPLKSAMTTTSSQGIASYTFTTASTGSFCVKVTASKTGYTSATTTLSLSVTSTTKPRAKALQPRRNVVSLH